MWTEQGEGVGQKTMFVHKGGGGSKISKNLSTWFMNDPIFLSSKNELDLAPQLYAVDKSSKIQHIFLPLLEVLSTVRVSL